MSQPIPIDGIVGARPNMMKMAPLARAIGGDEALKIWITYSGQRYAHRMSIIDHR